MIEEPSVTIPLPPGTEGVDRLRDGTPVEARRPQASDAALIDDLVRRISEESIERRYFSPIAPESVRSELMLPYDGRDRLALILCRQEVDRSEVVAQGEYSRDSPRSATAEVAFLVADAYQGKGAASILLRRLARAAREQGIQRFRAIVLPENQAMVEVFRYSGFPVVVERRDDALVVTIGIVEERRPLYEARTDASVAAPLPAP